MQGNLTSVFPLFSQNVTSFVSVSLVYLLCLVYLVVRFF